MRLLASMAATAVVLALVLAGDAVAASNKTRQVRVEYVPPNNPTHQQIYNHVKEGRALETLQTLLSPFKLPYPLTYRLAGCDGQVNAWYENDVVTVCYEMLEMFLSNAPQHDLPLGLTPVDTVIGSTLDTFLHETGHAVFDLLQIPVIGREEDAADQFSAYVMLRLDKDEARRMILGAAYGYRAQMPGGSEVTLSMKAFADEHSTPAQRAFNVLCLAYGADQKLFSDVVDKGFLPKKRADICAAEYGDVDFGFKKLIGPHVDKKLAKSVHRVWAQSARERRARLQRAMNQQSR